MRIDFGEKCHRPSNRDQRLNQKNAARVSGHQLDVVAIRDRSVQKRYFYPVLDNPLCKDGQSTDLRSFTLLIQLDSTHSLLYHPRLPAPRPVEMEGANVPANKSKSGGTLMAVSAWFRGLGLDVPTVLMMIKYAP